jgi:hypothetical protein
LHQEEEEESEEADLTTKWWTGKDKIGFNFNFR